MRKLDDWLIDRVFQRVADWQLPLTGRSCHWWAMQFLLGAAAMIPFEVFYEARTSRFFTVLCGLGLGGCYMEGARRAAREAEQRVPWLRQLIFFRYQLAFLLILSVPINIRDMLQGSADDLFSLVEQVLATLGFYIGSCVAMRPPPKPARNLAMGGA